MKTALFLSFPVRSAGRRRPRLIEVMQRCGARLDRLIELAQPPH